MNWLETYDDVVTVMQNDYSGFLDKKGWDNPHKHRSILQQHIEEGTITSQIFDEIVNDYLADFKDGHLYFFIAGNKPTNRGFGVRRFQDKLFVTMLGNEDRLNLGDAIIALDGMSIPQAAEKFRSLIEQKGTGQERENWYAVLNRCSKAVVKAAGNSFELELKFYEPKPYVPEYSFKQINSDTALITLSDFSNDDAINKLISEHRASIEKGKSLIIDVRKNRGGSDSAYINLLPFIFRGTFDRSSSANTMQFNMTERNYNLRQRDFKAALEQFHSEEAKRFLGVFIDVMEQHKGKGLIEVDLSEALGNSVIHGSDTPEKVVILTDVYCGSSGDAFVELAQKSEKVTLMGRATAGITDYSNLATQRYEGGFVLMYPTSRIAKIDTGQGLSGKGVQPDVHIPWTPEHIHRDLDLEQALEFLQG